MNKENKEFIKNYYIQFNKCHKHVKKILDRESDIIKKDLKKSYESL